MTETAIQLESQIKQWISTTAKSATFIIPHIINFECASTLFKRSTFKESSRLTANPTRKIKTWSC